MYIDILPNDNLDEPVMATFKETGMGRSVRAVRLLLDGTWQWCAVIGWDDVPTPARATPIEESGDGPAVLVHGGGQGLRLARIVAPDQAARVSWDLSDRGQWGEGFLVCRPDTAFVD